MPVLDRSTFNECLEKGIDVMLNNFAHIIEVTSFEQPAISSDSMVFKDKYKTFQEHRLLSRASANIFESASVLLGLCSEIKRELLINGVSKDNLSIKARYFTLMDSQKTVKSNIKLFSEELDEIIKTLEDSLYDNSVRTCSNEESINLINQDSNSDSSVSLNLPH